MLEDTGKIFVYGTLKIGGSFADIFDEVRISSEEATINGTLFCTESWFPGVVLGKDRIVFGELHEYKEFTKVIEVMDQIEGFEPESPKRSLFIRQKAAVETTHGEETATIYTFNGSTKDCEIIEDGVWLIQKEE